MLLSRFCGAANVALGKLSTALRVAPSRQLAPTRQSQQLAPTRHVAPGILAPARRPLPALRAPTRNVFNIPENQYENNSPLPKRLQLSYALLHNWEIIPLFLCVAFDMIVVLGGSIYTALAHKVDTQFTKHNWNCIARNMDLCNPTIHKHVVLYQRYEPWPEMQSVLDKMTQAEKRKKAAFEQCGK